jgi:hypothetical protein
VGDSNASLTAEHRSTSRRMPWLLILSLLCFTTLSLAIVFGLDLIISPKNHIILINQSGTNFTNLNVNVERSDKSRHVVYTGDCPNHSLHTVNWPYGFYGDWVEVFEAGGTAKRVPVNSHGRYGHSLIVLIGPDRKVLASHDSWPVDESSGQSDPQ